MPESPGGCVMDYTKKIRFGLGSFCAAFLLLSVLALQVASRGAPNFVGTWQMTMLAGGQGGQGGGHGGNGQGGAQPGDQGEGGGRAAGWGWRARPANSGDRQGRRQLQGDPQNAARR